MKSKIKTREELKEVITDLKTQNKKIVTTNGAFDLFHTGHLKTLNFAKKQGDVLIVGLNSDSSIKKYKSKKRPIIPEKERAKLVAATEPVNYVTIFEEETPVILLQMIKPNVHVKGLEYKEKIPEKDVVEVNGGKIVFIERDKTDTSTTRIIEKIVELYG